MTNSRSNQRSTERSTEQNGFSYGSKEPLFVLAVPSRSTGEGNLRIMGKTYDGVLVAFENARTDVTRWQAVPCEECE